MTGKRVTGALMTLFVPLEWAHSMKVFVLTSPFQFSVKASCRPSIAFASCNPLHQQKIQPE